MQAEVQNLFKGFSSGVVVAENDTCAVDIPYVTAGSGPPLLLLHGAPQTRVMWHRVAPTLAERLTVVATDLRGYGVGRSAKALLQMPVRVLLGEFAVLNRCFKPLDHWRTFASNVSGGLLPCGHYIAEEVPELLLAQCFEFFGDPAA